MADRIDFHFNVADVPLYVSRVVRKALAQKMTVGILGDDARLLEAVDRRLWMFDATGFYPHVRATDALAARTPVVYGTELALMTGRKLLVALAREPVADTELLKTGFERVFDIVADDPGSKAEARQRFVFYRQAGFETPAHDTAGEKS